MFIYNTMTSSKEEFAPAGDTVKMYVCGITVYDYCHIGHARSSVAFDMIRRILLISGFGVIFVKNFTDIDDKIINKARDTGEDWRLITERFIEAHDEDMRELFVLSPTHTPRATDFIEDMIEFTAELIRSGHAYEKNGDVYYRVSSFESYGKLSRRNIEELKSGARVDVNELKESPLDFALWKSAKPGEPSWPSPWGDGRPGWHLECSVMNEKILGERIDIHGGGQDLIFPHHENEIAQSEAHHGAPFAKYWIHNGFVNINKEKMSKSLGNFFTIRDILKVVNGETLRFFLLSTHYRQPLEYADSRLYEAESALERVYIFKDELFYAVPSKKGFSDLNAIDSLTKTFESRFKTALMDDFNTPLALAHLFEFVREANSLLAGKLAEEALTRLRESAEEIFVLTGGYLGIMGRSAADWFKSNLNMEESEVEKAIEERKQARAAKDFSKADSIRLKLSERGVELIDTPEGTRYRTKRVR